MMIEYHMLPLPSSVEDAVNLSVRFDKQGFVPDRRVSLTGLLESLALGHDMSFDDHHGRITKIAFDFVKRTALITVMLD